MQKQPRNVKTEKYYSKEETNDNADTNSEDVSESQFESLEEEQKKGKKCVTSSGKAKRSNLFSKDFKKKVTFKPQESSFFDFHFFESHGFYPEEWLNRIGAKILCGLNIEVFGEVVFEFYNNLKMKNESLLITKVSGIKVELNRKLLIECLGLHDVGDDRELISMSRSDVMKLLNDGIGEFKEKDIFNTEFELLIRLLHKIVAECILPKKGSPTSVSKEEALVILSMKLKRKIDLPKMILRHMWRNKNHMFYGNVIMKILQYKKVKFPKHNAHPQHLKKIGEKVLKHMSIIVKDNFWFSRDGAFYVHPRNRKNVLVWELDTTFSIKCRSTYYNSKILE